MHARLCRHARDRNDDGATAAAIDAARWMHSGDLAVMNDEGSVAITGRIKDPIIRGGENIYPRESKSSCTPMRRSPTCTSSACPITSTA